MKIGIIGAGSVTRSCHLPVLLNLEDVRVEWICDKSPAAAAALARSYGIPTSHDQVSACPSVDVVLVATPVGTRRDVVPEALARGWHVFAEKPFALTLEEHDFYLREAERHGVQIGVGQVRRYTSPTASARQLLQRRFLGPILRVTACDGTRVRATGRGTGWYMADAGAGGGLLTETGSHLVDQVLYVLDAETVALRDASQCRHLGIELASSLSAEVTALGQTFECSIDVSMLDDLCNGVFIEFPSYVLDVDSLRLLSRSGETLCRFVASDGVDGVTRAFTAEWRDFLRQCRTGDPSVVDAATVRNTTALIESCYRWAGDAAAPVASAVR